MIEIPPLVGLLIGTVSLYFGAEWIVHGGSHLAHRMGISRLAIGLTIVAFGTSLPELIVSVLAVLKGSSTIAIGNVVGSNVANVGLVLGLTTLIFPLSYYYKNIRRDLWIYLAICVVFIVFILDGKVQRLEGIILFTGLIGYLILCMKRPHPVLSEVDFATLDPNVKCIVLLVGGMVVLSVGAQVFVDGAVSLAELMGVSEVAIGMSVVALGTSLPELATSVVAAFRKEHGISIGNIVGSNIFNILCVIGIASGIHPLDAPIAILKLEIPFMVAFGLALIPLGIISHPISRVSSFILLAGYTAFIYLLF